MKEETITYYVTSDGMRFENKTAAEQHELGINSKDYRKEWEERTKAYLGTSGFLESICDCHDGYIYEINLKDGETLDDYERLFTKAVDHYYGETCFYTFGNIDMKKRRFLLVVNSSETDAEWVCVDTFLEDVTNEAKAVLGWLEN